MQLTFEHLLGLPCGVALAILSSCGITGVEVVPTAAPPRARPDERRSDEGERAGYAETRVVAVEADGRRLIVSRFLTGDPGEGGSEHGA